MSRKIYDFYRAKAFALYYRKRKQSDRLVQIGSVKRDARDVIPCQSPEAAPLVAVFSFKDGETIRRRSARGESKNSPVDCFLRGGAL